MRTIIATVCNRWLNHTLITRDFETNTLFFISNVHNGHVFTPNSRLRTANSCVYRSFGVQHRFSLRRLKNLYLRSLFRGTLPIDELIDPFPSGLTISRLTSGRPFPPISSKADTWFVIFSPGKLRTINRELLGKYSIRISCTKRIDFGRALQKPLDLQDSVDSFGVQLR